MVLFVLNHPDWGLKTNVMVSLALDLPIPYLKDGPAHGRNKYNIIIS